MAANQLERQRLIGNAKRIPVGRRQIPSAMPIFSFIAHGNEAYFLNPKYDVDWWRVQFFNHGLQNFQDLEEVFSKPEFDTV